MAIVNDPVAVPAGIVVLTKANARAKEIAAAAVANATLLSRPTTSEWANTFTQQVESMVVRALTIGTNGLYAWQTNPAIIEAIADYVEDAGAEQAANREELLSVAAGLRQAARAVGLGTGKLLVEAGRGAAEGFKPQNGDWVPTVVGLGIAAVAVAYVWRSFR